MSSINISESVPLAAICVHAIANLHHVWQMMCYASDPEPFLLFSTLFSSHHSCKTLSWLLCPKSLVPELSRLLPMFSGRDLPGLPVLQLHQWFVPCCKLWLFRSMKASLDCRLGQWHAYLLQSILELGRCFAEVFLHQEKSSVIIIWCLLRCFWARQCIPSF